MRAMQAIEVAGTGREARLVLGKAVDPVPRADEVRIEVHATAVNRADLMQRRGLYPPPVGASAVLGLECAGTVAEVGSEGSGFAVGDRVMALLSGGGYAEQACAHVGSVLRIPEHLSFTEAAAIPETFLTCYLNLFQIAAAPYGGWALVHGGGSGIGTSAIQLLREAGVHVAVTCGSREKCERCVALGADLAIQYREEEFAPVLLERTGGTGVDVVLDSIGAPYLAAHLQCLRTGGRLVWIGLMGGARAELALGAVVAKRLQLVGSTLRTRSPAEKAQIVRGFLDRFGAALDAGRLRPIVDRVLPLERAQEAHDVVDRSEHFGKLVLAVR
jgi:putative PIG3 family NAD(P)H quinone oxidoreductase